MKLRYGMLAIWVAVAVYSLGAFVYGPTGIVAMRHLALQKEKLARNLEQLELISQNLSYSVDSLLYDRETLEVLARDLGYGKPDESFIRISGTDSIFKSHYVVGSLVSPETSLAPLEENQLRLLALASGIIVFILAMLFGGTSQKRKKSRP
jgi:cell division protein FtsB